MKVFTLYQTQNTLIIPTSTLFLQHAATTNQLKNEGVDVRALMEASIIARNRADDQGLRRVGLECNILDSLKEEISCLLDGDSYRHLNKEDLVKVTQSAFTISFSTYLMIKELLSIFVGDLDDLDSDVICEDWLSNDLVISLHPK